VVARTDPNGHATHLAYDAYGDLASSSDALGRTTTYSYDLIGRTTTMTGPAGNATDGGAGGDTTTYGYDAFGDTTAMTDALGQTTTTHYDANGNVITSTDALSHTTSYSYDALDRAIGSTDPLGRATSYGYDGDGNVITSTDALGHATLYGYDSVNRLTTATDPLRRSTTYAYDLAGNRTAMTDAMGRTTAYRYDDANRLTGIAYAGGATHDVAYTYTATGQRESMTDGTGTTGYAYDALGRLTDTTNGAGRHVGYGYDATGNLTTLTYPDGNQVTRTYDALDRMTGVSDWLGHTTRFAYDANGALATQRYPNGATAALGYDAAGELTGITDTLPGAPAWTFGYGHDQAGELTVASDPLDGVRHTFGHDTRRRLTGDARTDASSGAAAGSLGWGYDAAHDLTSMTDATGGVTSTSTLAYDPASELTRLRTVSGPASTLTHDLAVTSNADGDRTSQTDQVTGAATSYGYDGADRLITATVSLTGGVTTASYSYDGDGLRQSKAVGGAASAETWDVAEGLPLLLQEGDTRYVSGPDGLPVEQVAADGTVQYDVRDAQGSTRGLLDAAGRVVATASFDAYGRPTRRAGTARTPFGYAGQYTDAETGLQYLRARYYDPQTAQFLTRDPLLPQTGDAYGYAAADPLDGFDPSGQGCTPFDGGFSLQSCGHDAAVALAPLANSDFVNTGYSELQGTWQAVDTGTTAAAQCLHHLGACARATGQAAGYAVTHPDQVTGASDKDAASRPDAGLYREHLPLELRWRILLTIGACAAPGIERVLVVACLAA